MTTVRPSPTSSSGDQKKTSPFASLDSVVVTVSTRPKDAEANGAWIVLVAGNDCFVVVKGLDGFAVMRSPEADRRKRFSRMVENFVLTSPSEKRWTYGQVEKELFPTCVLRCDVMTTSSAPVHAFSAMPEATPLNGLAYSTWPVDYGGVVSWIEFSCMQLGSEWECTASNRPVLDHVHKFWMVRWLVPLNESITAGSVERALYRDITSPKDLEQTSLSSSPLSTSNGACYPLSRVSEPDREVAESVSISETTSASTCKNTSTSTSTSTASDSALVSPLTTVVAGVKDTVCSPTTTQTTADVPNRHEAAHAAGTSETAAGLPNSVTQPKTVSNPPRNVETTVEEKQEDWSHILEPLPRSTAPTKTQAATPAPSDSTPRSKQQRKHELTKALCDLFAP